MVPPSSLGELIRAHRTELVRVARREGVGPEDAIECVHDAFCTLLELARKDEVPRDPEALHPFLGAIVKNAARNRRRRHHLARPHEPLESAPCTCPSDDPTAFDVVARAEEQTRLRACVDQLCAKQKTVVLLRILEERPGEDVASLLGLTRSHIDVLLHRAKQSLRECMSA